MPRPPAPIALPAVLSATRLLGLLQIGVMGLLTLLMGHLPGLSPAVEKSLFGLWVLLVGLSIGFSALRPAQERAAHLVAFGLGLPMLQVLGSWLAQALLI